MKIVFFGTPEFAVASLERLIADGHDIAAVVTMPDKPAGRGHNMLQSDVKKFAVANGLRVLQPERLKSPEFVDTLREINADLFIVIAFRMLPEVVWSMPRLGTFNLHGSLLPKYRGAAPINRAIMNGETETGITTFFLKHEIDTGDIIDRRSIPVADEDNAGTIHDKLMVMGADMVADSVRAIEQGNLVTVPQPDGEFIPAPKIFKEDCQIDWTRPAREVHNQVRGLSPYPAAFTTLQDADGKSYNAKIFTTCIVDLLPVDTDKTEPGDIVTTKHNMYILAGDGIWIEVLSLQPAGKKRMETSAFLAGYKPIRAVAQS